MPIVTCPTCATKLEIAPEDVGYKVQCGGCQGVFEAKDEKAERSRADDEDLPPSQRSKYRRDADDEEDDYDDRPRRRRSRYDADERADPNRQPGQGLGVASMILGIASIMVTAAGACCPPISLIGLVGAVLSIIFGILSLKTEGRGLGIAGLITSGITFLLVIAALIFYAAIMARGGPGGGAIFTAPPPASGAGIKPAPNDGEGEGITPRLVTKPGQPAPKQFQPLQPSK